MEWTFTAEQGVWEARRADTWVFATVPPDVSADIEDVADARGPRAGFGSVKVQARIGATVWRTSVFPDGGAGCFVLPLKRAVREANGIGPGDEAAITLEVV